MSLIFNRVRFIFSIAFLVVCNETSTSAELLDKLNKKSRVLCFIMANPANESKWKHLKNLYGKNCDKFLNQMKHKDGLEIFGVDIPEGRDHLAERCYKGFQYVYEQYYNDYDYFMRTDEDTYFVMENLRYLLSQYNPEWALWIGKKFHRKFNGTYYLYIKLIAVK